MEFIRKIAACALLVAASHPATAADQGFYFGVIGGSANYEFDTPQFIPAAGVIPSFGGFGSPPFATFTPAPRFFTTPVFAAVAILSPTWQPDDDDESTAWGVIAGYRIMRYAAVELNYLNLGTLKESDTVSLFPPGSGTLQIDRELETTGPSVSALGILPLLDQWSVYVRAGVLFADMELSSSLNNSSSSITFGSDSFLWGAGTQFDWGKHWSVRVDYQRFDSVGEENGAGRADIDLLSLGVLFRL